jgi:hypothetical protein
LSKPNIILLFLCICAIFVAVEACRKNEYSGGTAIKILNPSGFPAQTQFANTTLTKERIELALVYFMMAIFLLMVQ